ncbi:hypothetical protein ABPG73_010124 [Tetrahymena malaccensis]
MIFSKQTLAYQEIINKNLGTTSNCIPDQQNMWQTIGGGYINYCSVSCSIVGTSSFSALLISSNSNSGIKISIPTTLLTNPYSIMGVDIIYKEGANNQLRINLNNQASTILTVQSPTIYEEQNDVTCSSNQFQFYQASLTFQGTVSSSTFFVAFDQNQPNFAVKQIRIWTNCCQNCLQCSTSTTCLTCMTGFIVYSFPTGQQVCSQTSGCNTANCYSCAQYNGQEICLSCQPNYNLDANNVCQPNDINGSCNGLTQYLEYTTQLCQSYSLNCWYQISSTKQWIGCGNLENYSNYQCPYNKQVLIYYYQNYAIYQCSCLISNCDYCSQQNGCTQCQSGYNFNSSTNTCDLNCSNNQYFDSSSRTCINCGQNCYMCNSSACLTCNSSNYYINPLSPHDCQLCAVWDCQSCFGDVQNCLNCNTSNGALCDICNTNYLLSSDKKTCNCQVYGCQTCQVNNGLKCQTCYSGYFLSSINQKCNCAANNCQVSDPKNGQICLTCVTNYILGYQSICNCGVKSCRVCDINNGAQCQYCNSGFQLNSTTFKCDCQVLNCQTCNVTDGTTCQTCVNNYILSTDQKTCSCQVANCLQCNPQDGSKCNVCQNNYLLSSDQTKCSCQVTNCSQCSSQDGSICQTCIKNYLLGPNSKSYKNCLSCSSQDGRICLQCPSGYTLMNQTNNCKLTACQVQNCQTCVTNDVYTCSQCNNNFYLNGNQTSCLQCAVANCSTCLSTDYQQCFICNQGFQIDQHNQCQMIINDNKYTINPIASLTGYTVNIQFQQNLINININEEIQILNIKIPGFNKYNYTTIVSKNNQITVNINCFENIKNANIFIDFQLSQFVSQNNINELSQNAQLPAFVIVPQSVQQTVEQISSATSTASKTIVSSYLPIAFFGNFYFLVNMIDLTNFLYYLLFLDIRYPINVTDFYGLFKDFQFPFVPNLFAYLYDPSYNPSSPKKFMDMGTNSYLISNSGQAICICFYIISVYILAKLAHKTIPIRRIHVYLTRVLYETWEFSSFFDMMSAEYVYILIGCLLQSLNFDTSDQNSYIVNYMLYAFLLPFCILWPLILLIFIYKQKNLKSNQYLLIKLQSFLGGLRIENENPYFEQIIKQKEDQKQSQNNTLQSKENNNRNNSNHLEGENIKQIPMQNDVIQELAEEEQMASPVEIKKKQLSNDINLQKIIHLRQVSEMTNISSKAKELDLVSFLQIDIRTKRQKLIAKYSKLFSSMLYIRKILFSFIIVLLHGYCYLQITLISCLNLLVIFLIAYIQPYDCLSENIKNASSEVILIAIQICAATLVEDGQDDNEERRINVGWIIVCLSAFALLWNTLVLTKETVISFYQSFKKLLLTKESEQSKTQIFPSANQMETQKVNQQKENQNIFSNFNKNQISPKVYLSDIALKRKRSSFSSYRNQLNSIVSETLIPYPQSQVMTPSSLGSFAINTERIDQKNLQAKEIDEKQNIQNCKTEIVSVENNFNDDFNIYTCFSPKLSFVDSSHAIKQNKPNQNNLNQSGSIIQKRRRRSTNFKKDDITFLLNYNASRVIDTKTSLGNSPENNIDVQPLQNKKSSFSEYSKYNNSNNNIIQNQDQQKQINYDLQNKVESFVSFQEKLQVNSE